MIQFIYVNFRYILFIRQGRFYLLDRKPTSFFAYLLLPLHWMTTKKVYQLTENEGQQLYQQHVKMNKTFAISSIFIGGLITLFSSILSKLDIVNRTVKDMSNIAMFVSVLIGSLFIVILVECIYSIHYKNMNRIIVIDNKKPTYSRFYPKRPKNIIFKYIIIQLFFWLFLVALVNSYFSSRSLFFLYGIYLILFVLLLSSANAYNSELKYDLNVEK